MAIRIGIVGYGNIGKAIEREVNKSNELKLVAIFTRRDPHKIESKHNVYRIDELDNFIGKIDVMILCLGSANDLTKNAYKIAENFNTVDSFDTHSKIPEYYTKMNQINNTHNTTSVISVGWDPGLFSYSRLLFDSILPDSNIYTFWGSGVSQGHSEAIRRIEGVEDAIQYTHPKKEAVERVRTGENAILSTREKHYRECYVVLKEDTRENRLRIESEIKNMPNYFNEYDTIVHFVDQEGLDTNHSRIYHGGFVIGSGKTGDNNKEIAEFSLKLDSNPEFTSSVLIAYAIATYRLSEEGKKGTFTIFDIPLKYISYKLNDEIIKNFL